MKQTNSTHPEANVSGPESATQPTPADGFRFHCPVCESYRGIAFRPCPGYHILCAGCLAVLVVVKGEAQEPTGLAVRTITDTDLERMVSDVRRALLEAKERLLSMRMQTGARTESVSSLRPPSDD
jgi:hypothetical protein